MTGDEQRDCEVLKLGTIKYVFVFYFNMKLNEKNPNGSFSFNY